VARGRARAWFHGLVEATSNPAATPNPAAHAATPSGPSAPGSPAGEPARPAQPGGAAARAVLAQWPFAAVFAVAVIGVLVIAAGALQHGLMLLAVALLLGSVLRFVLTPVRAGLLAVRRRGVDVVTMALLGAVLLVLAMVPLTV
jgi:Protein of unknown function (DUF3017)